MDDRRVFFNDLVGLRSSEADQIFEPLKNIQHSTLNIEEVPSSQADAHLEHWELNVEC